MIAGSYHYEIEDFQVSAPAELIPTIEAAVRSTVPNARFGGGRLLAVKVTWGDGLCVEVALANSMPQILVDKEILAKRYNLADRQRRIKERVRLAVLKALEEAFDLAPAHWGILMGVRPTKMVHTLTDQGFSERDLRKILSSIYGVNGKKIDLLLEVAGKQKHFFHPTPNQPISIYIGIPFCPTRCSYCSFAAYPLKTHGHLFEDFIHALYTEIKGVGSLLNQLNIEVESLYLGGGTPTTVQGKQLEKLLSLIRQYLTTPKTKEVTVEAGRPETLSLETLRILQDYKIDRICINPQTMHDGTLKAIGRNHSAAEIRKAYKAARKVGIPLINMDIILGLPKETATHVEQTLEEIEVLQPDNLTVHGLAVKRASRLKKAGEDVQIAQEEGQRMAQLARKFTAKWGMFPYYLYRQRHILGGLENVGYALPGTESVYNVQMMEERQTIIALGAGGITKLVAPDQSLVRQVNPKCPATYTQQIKGSLEAKIRQICQHLAV